MEDKYLTQNIKAGSQIMIPVTVTGSPKPSVTWTLNGKDVESFGNISVETLDESSTLKVKGSVARNAGKYCVTAENEVGSESMEINVSIIGEINGFLLYFFFQCKIQNFLCRHVQKL